MEPTKHCLSYRLDDSLHNDRHRRAPGIKISRQNLDSHLVRAINRQRELVVDFLRTALDIAGLDQFNCPVGADRVVYYPQL
jgi:hypothetical protein